MTAGTPADETRIVLLTKPGCHLCDVARSVIEHVAAECDVGWREYDIDDSERYTRAYWDKIPVTLIDGAEHSYWRVSADRLRAALDA